MVHPSVKPSPLKQRLAFLSGSCEDRCLSVGLGNYCRNYWLQVNQCKISQLCSASVISAGSQVTGKGTGAKDPTTLLKD